MRQLLKVHISVWALISATVTLSVISVIFILNYEVEDVYQTQIKFNSSGTFFEIPANDSYMFSIGNTITIRFNERYYIGEIGQITSSTGDLMKVPITWSGASIPEIPNGSFNVEIIHKFEKLLYSIFSPSV